jgi:subtilisin family serine protease
MPAILARKLVCICLILLVAALLTATAKTALAGVGKGRPTYVPGELIVQYKSSRQASTRAFYRRNFNIKTKRSFKRINARHLKLPARMTVSQALELYRNDPDVEFAEPNYYIYATLAPNDTHYTELWGLNNTGQSVNGTAGTLDADMDVAEAWDITTGGSGVIVAVVDSGVDYNHPDLKNNIWVNPGETAADGIDNDGNGKIDDVNGWDFIDNDNAPIDSDGHGTHVAGTIAAVGNNGSGISGVSWAAKIMVLRFLNAFGSGTTADAISAIEYANAEGAHIINNSWGGSGYSAALKAAIDASSAVVVCAAGNEGTNNDTSKKYPASYTSTNIISVAATDQDDGLAGFSNFGATSVDVGAPGTNIYSTQPDRQNVFSDNFDDGSILDWTTGGTNNTWAVTTAEKNSGTHSLTDSPGGNYVDSTDSNARAPALNLAAHTGAKLQFQIKGASQTFFDYLYVETSTNLAAWTSRSIRIGNTTYSAGLSGSIAAFAEATVDLGALDGQNPAYFRFRFISNGATTADGWYIDDVVVSAADTTYTGAEFTYFNGTSMAAPHVSGVAALLKTQNAELTNIQIKAAIENSVDAVGALAGFTATGGRVNALAALTPTAPSGLSATTASSSQINLSWTDNSSNETGFKIERSTGGGYSQVGTAGTNAASYSDSGLSASTQYTYRVRAYNSAGNSGYSGTASATTTAPPPTAPTGLSATAVSSSQINLGWTDNSNNETGFKIERSTGGAFNQIDTASPNATSYNDSGLSTATQYTYRVRAYNGGGDSSYSSSANATTFAAAGGGGGGGGGCFIATAAYGTASARHVKTLRIFRDRYLLTHTAGRAFIHFYYRYSPPAADVIAQRPFYRKLVRMALAPLIIVCAAMLKWGPGLTLFLGVLALMAALKSFALLYRYRIAA